MFDRFTSDIVTLSYGNYSLPFYANLLHIQTFVNLWSELYELRSLHHVYTSNNVVVLYVRIVKNLHVKFVFLSVNRVRSLILHSVVHDKLLILQNGHRIAKHVTAVLNLKILCQDLSLLHFEDVLTFNLTKELLAHLNCLYVSWNEAATNVFLFLHYNLN